jgi:hypothetical protein
MNKYVAELGRELNGRELDIYEGRSGLSEAKRQLYISLWKGERVAVRPAEKTKPQSVRNPKKKCCGQKATPEVVASPTFPH